jgi:hypothetical protein
MGSSGDDWLGRSFYPQLHEGSAVMLNPGIWNMVVDEDAVGDELDEAVKSLVEEAAKA